MADFTTTLKDELAADMKSLAEEQKYTTIASWITALNVLIASGFTIQSLVSPKSFLGPEAVVTDAAVVFSMYAVARIVPLTLVTLAVIYKRSRPGLFVVGLVAGFMQLLDAPIGVYQHDVRKTVAPLVLAVLQFAVLYKMRKTSQVEK
jgi:hypothetical protein